MASEAPVAMVGIISAGLIELAKMGLQIWFAAMRQSGLSEEQQKLLYEKQKAQFLQNEPNKLPDV